MRKCKYKSDYYVFNTYCIENESEWNKFIEAAQRQKASNYVDGFIDKFKEFMSEKEFDMWSPHARRAVNGRWSLIERGDALLPINYPVCISPFGMAVLEETLQPYDCEETDKINIADIFDFEPLE